MTNQTHQEALASMAEDQAILIELEGDVCLDCGNTPETGACFCCKAD